MEDLQTPAAPPSKSSRKAKIKDFGEKIAGARKDAMQDYETLLAMPVPDNADSINIYKVLPSPDYGRLIAEGFGKRNAAILRAVRDVVPRKPVFRGDRDEWVKQVMSFKKAMLYIVSKKEKDDVENTVEGVYKILGKVPGLGRRMILYSCLGYPFFMNARGWDAYVGRETFPDLFPRHEFPPDITGIVLFWGCLKEHIVSRKADPTEAMYSLASQIKNHHEGLAKERRLLRNTSETYYYIVADQEKGGFLIGRYARGCEFIPIKRGFLTKEAARNYWETNVDGLKAAWEKLRRQPTGRKKSNEERTGPARHEGNVTPEVFSAAFAFRGVQFGNYLEAGRRELELNRSYDALMDLAEALGIPSQNISLDGQLGLAFGARGRSGAAAHYESDQCVINLTKSGGPGCLAHEWFHGFDNYLCRIDDSGDSSWKRATFNYATSRWFYACRHYKNEINDALQAILDKIRECAFYKSSQRTDVFRKSDYWSTDRELTARAFEVYIQKKLKVEGITNDFLVNIDSYGSIYPSHDDIAGVIEENFDTIFTAFRNGTKGVLKEKKPDPEPAPKPKKKKRRKSSKKKSKS